MADKTIAIIGAGIGGVAAGVALRQAGFSVRVFEKAGELREAGAGLSVWPNGTGVLRQLGLLPAVASQGQNATHFLVRSQSGEVLMEIGTAEAETPTVCVHRAHLLRVLADALPPECLGLGHELAEMRFAADKVDLRFTNGERLVCDGVVGADGIYSRMRGRLAQPSRPVYRGYAIFRGIADAPGHFRLGHNSESWGAGSRFGILAIGNNKVCWYATVNSARPPRPGDWPKERLQQMFSRWHRPIPEFIAATGPSAILMNMACDHQPARCWNEGPATLIGDASHALTPNLGQGACMAMEDALVLANCLRRHHDVITAFRRYEETRYPRVRNTIWRSRWLGEIGQWENRAVVSVRNAVTKILPGRIFECHYTFAQLMVLLARPDARKRRSNNPFGTQGAG
ncbi:MAG TPA: FAD-dependent monooxygenase [Candidatus Binatia bacterium]|nr:FAD-dependent monooxygenase [Candidatus Binatia bacterium]